MDPKLLRSFALESDGKVLGLSKSQRQTDQADRSEGEDDEENVLRKELVKEQLLREELLRQQAAIREQKLVQHPTPTTAGVVPTSVPLNPSVKRPASPCSSVEARPSKGNIFSSVVLFLTRLLFSLLISNS